MSSREKLGELVRTGVVNAVTPFASLFRKKANETLEPFFSPLAREHKRRLDPEYDGYIYIWDIDKTYIDTKSDRLTDFLMLAFEKPHEKVNVPGTRELLAHLKKGPGTGNDFNPVFFLTAGPPLIGHRFEEKLRLDGVESDGTTFKSWVYYLSRGNWKNLWNHVGYKVMALLRNRLEFPPGAREILFGDNSEQDPMVYSLYTAIASGSLKGDALRHELGRLNVPEPEVREIVSLQEQLPQKDPVDQIYIHMVDRRRSLDASELHGKIIGTYNTFQTACHLYTKGRISFEGLDEVGGSLRNNFHFTRLDLARSLFNLWRRGHVDTAFVDRLIAEFREKGHFPKDLERSGEDFTILPQKLPIHDFPGSTKPVEPPSSAKKPKKKRQ